MYYWNCTEKITKINKKEAGIGPFFKDFWEEKFRWNFQGLWLGVEPPYPNRVAWTRPGTGAFTWGPFHKRLRIHKLRICNDLTVNLLINCKNSVIYDHFAVNYEEKVLWDRPQEFIPFLKKLVWQAKHILEKNWYHFTQGTGGHIWENRTHIVKKNWFVLNYQNGKVVLRWNSPSFRMSQYSLIILEHFENLKVEIRKITEIVKKKLSTCEKFILKLFGQIFELKRDSFDWM